MNTVSNYLFVLGLFIYFFIHLLTSTFAFIQVTATVSHGGNNMVLFRFTKTLNQLFPFKGVEY